MKKLFDRIGRFLSGQPKRIYLGEFSYGMIANDTIPVRVQVTDIYYCPSDDTIDYKFSVVGPENDEMELTEDVTKSFKADINEAIVTDFIPRLLDNKSA